MNRRVTLAFLLLLRLSLVGQNNFYASTPIEQVTPNVLYYYNVNFTTSDGRIWEFYRAGTAMDTGHAALVLKYSTDGGTTWNAYTGNSYCQAGDPVGCVVSDPNCCSQGNTINGILPDGSKYACTTTPTPPGVAYGMRVVAAGVNPITNTVVLSWQVFYQGPAPNPFIPGSSRFGCLYMTRMTLSGGVWGVSAPYQVSITDNPVYLHDLDGCYGGTIQVPPGVVINGTTTGASGAIGMMCEDNWLGGGAGCTTGCRSNGNWVIWSFDDGLTWATALNIPFVTNDPTPVYFSLSEDSILYMGGTTLLGFGRGNETTIAAGPNCCNSMVRMYSTDMGATWDLKSTGIQPLPQTCAGQLYAWMHVSPWLMEYTPDGSMVLLLNERQYITPVPVGCQTQNSMRVVNASATSMEQNPTTFWQGKIQNLMFFSPEIYSTEIFGYASAQMYGSQIMMQYNRSPSATNPSSIFTTLLSTSGYSLTMNVSGTGQGTVTSTPTGIVCPIACFNTYAPNVSITLTPKAAVGSYFVAWSGAGCSGSLPCAFTLSTNTTVNAVFNRNPAHHSELGKQVNFGPIIWK